VPRHEYRELVRRIIAAYDSTIVRSYCKLRFTVINIDILHILGLCLRGKRRVLDIGCGFGLFGCYFSAAFPEVSYCGYDRDPKRIDMARRAAARLGLPNVTFACGDAQALTLEDQFDAIMIIDLLHHLDDAAKHRLLETCAAHLAPDGRFIVKDVTTHPFAKLAFTWILDVLMTRGLQMWYWDERASHAAFGAHFNCIDTYPISDWMPYPHIVYRCQNH
jgi:2-polyprenyl-3-methyl-5-hydroxy-6-metoxy-1,4-benzoquinol methylase